MDIALSVSNELFRTSQVYHSPYQFWLIGRRLGRIVQRPYTTDDRSRKKGQQENGSELFVGEEKRGPRHSPRRSTEKDSPAANK
jgi:hypothetical protein